MDSIAAQQAGPTHPFLTHTLAPFPTPDTQTYPKSTLPCALQVQHAGEAQQATGRIRTAGPHHGWVGGRVAGQLGGQAGRRVARRGKGVQVKDASCLRLWNLACPLGWQAIIRKTVCFLSSPCNTCGRIAPFPASHPSICDQSTCPSACPALACRRHPADQ